MEKVVITGASGFLGWHLRCLLHSTGGHEVVPLTRAQFGDHANLVEAVRGAGTLFHLAGVNRAHDDDSLADNRLIAEALGFALEAARSRPVVVYANSIHAASNTRYGTGKRAAGDILRRWCLGSGAPFVNCHFPHLFGEGGRPFYNSVVATLCRQLVDGAVPEVNPQGSVELLHAQDACDMMLEAAATRTTGDIRPTGTPMTVPELLDKLRSMRDQYERQLLPNLADPLTLRLFNTYRSYLPPASALRDIAPRNDARGHLFEAVRGGGGGQSFVSWSHPGVVRGNHYHRRKVERFVVLQGQALIRVRRLFDSAIAEYHASGDKPGFIDMPTLHTHTITNVGNSELITLFWAHEVFDPSRPDTHAEPV